MNVYFLADKSPGCYVDTDPFKNPYSYVINDPGFNLMMSNVVLNYLVPSVAMIFLSLLLCTTRWTKVREYILYTAFNIFDHNPLKNISFGQSLLQFKVIFRRA
jgi:hypothetical protein